MEDIKLYMDTMYEPKDTEMQVGDQHIGVMIQSGCCLTL